MKVRNSHRLLPLSVLGLLALVAVAVVAVWNIRADTAEASGATMSYRVFSDKDNTQLICDFGSVGRKCNVNIGTSFNVEVVATNPPATAYDAYQIVTQYTSNLTLKQQAGFDENKVQSCLLGSEEKTPPAGDQPGRYQFSCKFEQETTQSGPLANIQFNCSSEKSSGQIDLIGGAGANVSVYVSPHIQGSLVFLKSQAKDGKMVADSIDINCVNPAPTPTPTGTATPTPTPTPAVPKARMALQVYNSKDKTVLVCDTGPIHRECNIRAGDPFSVDVLASSPPAVGYEAFQIVLQYPNLLTLQQQPGTGENRSPKCNLGSEEKTAPTSTTPGRYLLSCKLGPPITHYAGTLANVQFDCGTGGGQAQIDLIGGTGANVSVYVNPSIFGSLIFLKSVAKGSKNVADSVVINCLPDKDFDGCTDGQEQGSDPEKGGMRSPNNHWDFYDVWTQSTTSPSGWVRNREIDLFGDIFGVATRFGAMRSSPPTKIQALGEALVPPSAGDKTGYHAAFDRGVQIGPNPWDLAPPDGTIDLFTDINGIAAQFGHSCSELP
ncbi:MAG: flexitail domain-containing putative surface protein [Dehalococcoidia bacterium]|nr:flexitail domain-containing putative surface protein [Dehalococcoidia bacterium]